MDGERETKRENTKTNQIKGFSYDFMFPSYSYEATEDMKSTEVAVAASVRFGYIKMCHEISNMYVRAPTVADSVWVSALRSIPSWCDDDENDSNN